MTNYNDGNWHKVNGNKPESVHSLSEVEMKWIILDTGKVVESNRIAKHFEWRDFGDVFGIAFRVIKEHKEPREFYAQEMTTRPLSPNKPIEHLGTEWRHCDKETTGAILFREVIE